MQNNALVPVPPEPPSSVSLFIGAQRAYLTERLSPNFYRSLKRVLQQCTRLDDGHGRIHLLWAGPVRPDTGVPMLHRWGGKKNVPVHRALWAVLFDQEPVGYPRRLAECAYANCVSPMCFTVATPVEAGNLPEVMTRGRRVDHNGQPVANYKVGAGALAGAPFFSDVYVFRPEMGFTLLKLTNADGVEFVVPTCPCKHIIVQWLLDWHQHMGDRYRCHECTKLMRFVKEVRSRQPRAGFRPITSASINREQEIKDYLATRPFGEPVDPLDDDTLSHAEFERTFMDDMRRYDDATPVDDEGYHCVHADKLRDGTMTKQDWIEHGDEE